MSPEWVRGLLSLNAQFFQMQRRGNVRSVEGVLYSNDQPVSTCSVSDGMQRVVVSPGGDGKACTTVEIGKEHARSQK